MSWDKGIEREMPCPCGMGKVIISMEFDDWNRTRTEETILCVQCREKKNLEIKLKHERDLKFKELSSKVISYFNDCYLESWLSYFGNKNKKNIWESASNKGIERCSLSRFYSKYKTLTIEEYIKKLVRVENIRKIMKELNIKDVEFESLLDEAMEIYDEQEKERYNEVYRNRK
jgi:hypothetical protein